MAQRSDLLFEVDTTLDGSGNYTSPWIESAEVHSVVAVWTDGVGGSSGYPKFNLSADATNVIRSVESLGVFGEYKIPARYFRFQISGGTANATLRVSIKALT
jgi:hypothetical protein